MEKSRIVGIVVIAFLFAGLASGSTAGLSSCTPILSNGIVTTKDCLRFEQLSSGIIQVKDVQGNNVARIGFGISGTIGGGPQSLASWNTTWNWNTLSNSDSNVSLQSSTNYSGLSWAQNWEFSKQKSKVSNSLTNNTGGAISNAKFYYIVQLDVSQITYTNDANQTLTVSSTDVSDPSVLNNWKTTLRFGNNTLFDFQDLKDNGFSITNLFVGNLQSFNASLPNQFGLVLGMTKNAGNFPNGAKVELDPVITSAGSNITSPFGHSIGYYNNKTWFVYDDISGGPPDNNAAIVTSTNRGVSWGSALKLPSKITNGIGQADSANGFVDKNGILHVFYAAQQFSAGNQDIIVYQNCDFNNTNCQTAANFSSPIIVGNYNTTTGASGKAFQVDANGSHLFLAFLQTNSSSSIIDLNVMQVRLDANQANRSNWTNLISKGIWPSVNSTKNLGFTIDANRNFHFATVRGSGVETFNYKLYDANLNTFRIDENVEKAVQGANPVGLFVGTDLNARILVRATNATVMSLYDRKGGSWGNDSNNLVSNWQQVGSSIDGNNNIIASYSTTAANQMSIVRFHYDINNTWGSNIVLYDGGAGPSNSRIVQSRVRDQNWILFGFTDGTNFDMNDMNAVQVCPTNSNCSVSSSGPVADSNSITADFSYTIHYDYGIFDLNDTSTVSGTVVINDWNWDINGSRIVTGLSDANYAFSANADYNACLFIRGTNTQADINYLSNKCQTISPRFAQFKLHVLDENAGGPIIGATIVFDGNTFYSGTSDGNFYILSLAGYADKNYQATISKTGYGTRYFVWDLNAGKGADSNVSLLATAKGKDINFRFYDVNGNLQKNVLVDINISGDKNFVSRRYTSSSGTTSFFLNPDANYRFTLNPRMDGNVEIQNKVKVIIHRPKDEATDQNLNPYKVSVSGIFGNINQGLNGDFNYFVFSNTYPDYYLNLVDYNASYYTRYYLVRLQGAPLTYEIQPYLTLVASSYNTTLTVLDATTRYTQPNIEIKIYKDLNSVRTLVSHVVSDASGTATISFIANETYYLQFIQGGNTLITEKEVRVNNATMYAYLDLGQTSFPTPIYGRNTVTFSPDGETLAPFSPYQITMTFNNNSNLSVSRVNFRVTQGSNVFYDINDTTFPYTATASIQQADLNLFSSLPIEAWAIVYDNSGKVYTYKHLYGIPTGAPDLVTSFRAVRQQEGYFLTGIIVLLACIGVLWQLSKGGLVSVDSAVFVLLPLLALFAYIDWIPWHVFFLGAIGGVSAFLLAKRL